MTENLLDDSWIDWLVRVIVIGGILGIGVFCGIMLAKKEVPKEHWKDLGCMLVTKYNEKEKSCPSNKMADGQVVWVGACAISPDLRDSGLLMLGDIIYVDDYGILQICDYTHKKHKRLIDVYTDNLKEAKKHGAVRKRTYLQQYVKQPK